MRPGRKISTRRAIRRERATIARVGWAGKAGRASCGGGGGGRARARARARAGARASARARVRARAGAAVVVRAARVKEDILQTINIVIS